MISYENVTNINNYVTNINIYVMKMITVYVIDINT